MESRIRQRVRLLRAARTWLAKAAAADGRNSRRWLRDLLLNRDALSRDELSQGVRESLVGLRRWAKVGSADLRLMDRLRMARAVRLRTDVDTVRRIAGTAGRRVHR
jgi:hypothetical protein